MLELPAPAEPAADGTVGLDGLRLVVRKTGRHTRTGLDLHAHAALRECLHGRENVVGRECDVVRCTRPRRRALEAERSSETVGRELAVDALEQGNAFRTRVVDGNRAVDVYGHDRT